MAVFTTADRDAVKSAIITAATEGVAEVAVGSQRVRTYTLDELYKLLNVIVADLGSADTRFGMRMVKTVPPGAG